VKLYQQFQWQQESKEDREFFRPLLEPVLKSLQYA